ncbi:MAG: hypothetical protein II757_00015 [Bacteroidales bacterium]|jgi:predicted transcriptional regulator|nr:hypothetical protein [Bacteroidales bacterium]MCR5114363.1 hypothetical protein [Bacteroidales bacterium]
MKIEEITSLISGTVVEGEAFIDREVDCAFASDLMSDVLTLRTDKSVMLITGLCNMQTIRTCEMSDIKVVIFVRGKVVTEEMKELAADNDMVLITTNFSLYRTSGLLFNTQLPGVY